MTTRPRPVDAYWHVTVRRSHVILAALVALLAVSRPAVVGRLRRYPSSQLHERCADERAADSAKFSLEAS